MAKKSVIDVAPSNRASLHRTLNAAGAIHRLENLIEEMEHFQALEDADRAIFKETSFFNYATVAAVTCLEWHAKSRLVDLISFAPDALTSDDIDKFNQGDLRALVVDIIKGNATASELIGLSRNISTANSYLSVFERIFQHFGHKIPLSTIIGPFNKAAKSDFIQQLFEQRHRLVHEINLTEIGPYLFRDPSYPQRSLETLKNVLALVNAIETAVSTATPMTFPNRTDSRSRTDAVEDATADLIRNIDQILLQSKSSNTDQWEKIKSIDGVYTSNMTDATFHFSELRPTRWLHFWGDLHKQMVDDRYKFFGFLHRIIKDNY